MQFENSLCGIQAITIYLLLTFNTHTIKFEIRAAFKWKVLTLTCHFICFLKFKFTAEMSPFKIICGLLFTFSSTAEMTHFFDYVYCRTVALPNCLTAKLSSTEVTQCRSDALPKWRATCMWIYFGNICKKRYYQELDEKKVSVFHA